MSLAEVFAQLQSYLAVHTLLAPFVFAFFHIVFAVCIIPCSPMALIAGALWGKWLGLGISIASAFLASCTTFALARLLFRKKIYSFLVKKYAKTDWFLEQTKKHGWKFVAFTQLNPAAPGSTLGYIFGLTEISFSVYAIFLLVFMLPLQVILVLCGDSMPTLLTGKMPWLLLLVMLLVILYFVYGAKREGKS